MTSSCSATTLSWDEEVQLADGRVIVVKRHEELSWTGFPVYSRGLTKYHHFCYPPLGIQWKSKPDYFPETFDIVNEKAYVKVSLSTPEQCFLHGYPNTDAIYFRWDDRTWKKIDYSEFPKGLRYNMLNNTYNNDPKRDVKGLVTLQEKEKRDVSIHHLMKRKPEITGLNQTPSRHGMCESAKGIKVQTTETTDIFLPFNASDCK